MFSAKLFVDKRTLQQKAGCAPNQLGRVVLKELVDNGLDAGAGTVTLTGDATRCTVTDDGPGLDPDEVPRLFAVNRPLVSSKLKRLPTRGMLGNGLRVMMGAVAALGGTISVTIRGRRYELIGTDTVTGATKILAAADMPEVPGVTVELEFQKPAFSDADYNFARQAITITRHGDVYDGHTVRQCVATPHVGVQSRRPADTRAPRVRFS
jgi:DNA topoisomerase VI subunit B